MRRLSDQVSTAHRQARMAEDLDAAYVGPGTWVRDHSSAKSPSNGPTGGIGLISKIVISGEFPAENTHGFFSPLKVQAWEICATGECAWGEVPFFLTDLRMAGFTYRRGLASWTVDGKTHYVLMTFHKDGLYIERIQDRNGKPGRRSFYMMDRVN